MDETSIVMSDADGQDFSLVKLHDDGLRNSAELSASNGGLSRALSARGFEEIVWTPIRAPFTATVEEILLAPKRRVPETTPTPILGLLHEVGIQRWESEPSH